MVEIASWKIADSPLKPFAELFHACRINLSLEMSLLLVLVQCAPCPGPEIKKQLAVFLIAQFCIFHDIFEFTEDYIGFLTLLFITDLFPLLFKALCIVFLFARSFRVVWWKRSLVRMRLKWVIAFLLRGCGNAFLLCDCFLDEAGSICWSLSFAEKRFLGTYSFTLLLHPSESFLLIFLIKSRWGQITFVGPVTVLLTPHTFMVANFWRAKLIRLRRLEVFPGSGDNLFFLISLFRSPASRTSVVSLLCGLLGHIVLGFFCLPLWNRWLFDLLFWRHWDRDELKFKIID